MLKIYVLSDIIFMVKRVSKLDKKGFVISGIIYSLLILFLLLLFGILSIMGARKMILDKLKNEVIEELNGEEVNLPSSISFAEDSWETIAEIVKLGMAEKFYNVGDTKEVTVNGYTNGTENTFTVRIANMSTPMECEMEGFSQTACGFVVEFVDIITTHNVNSIKTNLGGWPASEMYNFVNTDVYTALPSDLQNIIIDTYTVSGYGRNESSNFISTDKLYLFSTKEIWGKEGISNTINYDSAENETRQLDYYKNKKVTTDSYSEVVKKYQGSAIYWWLRAAYLEATTVFYSVDISGFWSIQSAYTSNGVAPAFRIG